MSGPLPDDALDALFLTARTQNKWLPVSIEDATLARLFDLLKMAPTAANSSPARFVFVKTPEAKQRLAPALYKDNLDKTMSAPVTVIVATDKLFYEQLPKLFPHVDAKSWFTSDPAMAEVTAFRNSSLQGAYLILAARALGLDTGAMSGFDNSKVDEAFFAGTSWTANFLVNLGRGDPSGVFARSPRLSFDEACRIV